MTRRKRPPLTPDQVSDLIELICDTIDEHGATPDVSATITADLVEIRVKAMVTR